MAEVLAISRSDAPRPRSEEPKRAIDRTKPASMIAAKFGGLVKMAAALDKAPSTCHRWLVSGFIPSKHQADVLAAAKREKIKLRAEDFLPQSFQ